MNYALIVANRENVAFAGVNIVQQACCGIAIGPELFRNRLKLGIPYLNPWNELMAASPKMYYEHIVVRQSRGAKPPNDPYLVASK